MNDSRSDDARPQNAGERGRLDSWKKIAVHFNRDVTTVQRWERREGMPVHRHVHDKQGSVYAFRSELDAWWGSRRGKLPDSGDSAPEPLFSPPPVHLAPVSPKVPPEPAAAPDLQALRFTRLIRRPLGLAATNVAVLLLVYLVFRFGYPAREHGRVARQSGW